MKESLKIYNSAPLPFNGQKRFFIKKFREVLASHISNEGEGWTVIDVFGGSGLLAHNAKRLLPKARVIYNDYENYSERLQHIDDINNLRTILFDLLIDEPRYKKIDNDIRAKIIQVIENFQGYIDIQSLASWLLFSGKQVKNLEELYKHSWYNSVRTKDFLIADDYLTGLEITSKSFVDLMPQFNAEKVLLLLDPPYLHTGQGSYKQGKYFGMVEFLKLINLTKPPYIFFSSTKSELLQFMDYLQEYNPKLWQKIGNFKKISVNSNLNYSIKYEDNMIFKF